jgi:hypothetical protein
MELGHQRAGPSHALPALGCLVGLLVGVGLALLLSLLPDMANDPNRAKLQGEIVFLMMIGGIIGGLILRQVRSLRQRRGRDRK